MPVDGLLQSENETHSSLGDLTPSEAYEDVAGGGMTTPPRPTGGQEALREHAVKEIPLRGLLLDRALASGKSSP